MTTPYTRLAEQINKATAAGKLVDVSGLTPDGQKGKLIPTPTTTRTTKRWIQGLPVASDNYSGFHLAMTILSQSGQDFTRYSQLYLDNFGQGTKNLPVGPAKPRAKKAVGFVGPAITAEALRTKLVNALQTAQSKGKVLDVSKLQVDGTGARARPFSKSGAGSRRQIGDFPVISNNYGSFKLAMDAFGPDYAGVAQHFLTTYGAGAIPKTPRGTKAGGVAQPISAEALRDKVAAALATANGKGKFLDVSKLEIDGTGMRAMKIPVTGHGTKRWLPEVGIASNNYDAYRRAVEAIGHGHLAQNFLARYGAAPIVRSPAAAKGPVASPRRFGPIISAFPVTAGAPAIIQLPDYKPGARRVKSPAIAVQQTLIPGRLASPPRQLSPNGLRLPSPTRLPSPPRVATPTRLPSPVRFASPTRQPSPVRQLSPARLPLIPGASPTRF